ncbi:tuberin-like, partial [Paramuricea clavata]
MARPPDKFRSRLKQLLGLKRDTSSSLSPQLPPIVVEEPVECDELLKEVHPESGNSQSSRARVLKELCEVVAAKQLEEHAVEALWLAVKDLLQPENPADVRHITLQFLTSLVTGQYGSLKLLRAHFFKVIEAHNVPDDLMHRLLFLKALTLEGKDILFFEEQIGPFLLSLMPSVVFGEKLDTFFPLLRNFIRYNSSYLDEDVVSGLVKQTCQISTTTDKEKEVEQSLAILDAVVRYSSLPSSALYSFLVAVCNTVNVEQFCEPSWRLMRHLLGTHLGHNGVLTMCCILEDSNNWNKFSLLRGAIFFVGMCLWGSKRVTSLLHKPIAVLPSFYKVLSCDNESVICEVTLSMQRLVKKYGMKQHDTAWESILDIASALQEYVERHPSCTSVSENFHVLLSYIEELHEKHEFYGSADKLFAIVAKCTKKRPESSVILLVSHRAQSLHPYCDNWFENIKDLVDRYFKCEERTAIRIKVLDVLCNILGTFSPLYEEEILENSVLPYLDHIAKDRDIAVRIRAVQLLVDVIEGSDSQKVCDVLNIIEKIARCPVDPLKRYVRPSQHGSSKEQ